MITRVCALAGSFFANDRKGPVGAAVTTLRDVDAVWRLVKNTLASVRTNESAAPKETTITYASQQ